MTNLIMPKDNRVMPGSWGESKQRTNVMLTPTAIKKVDSIADKMKLTRSEIIERLIRTDCLDAEILEKIVKDD